MRRFIIEILTFLVLLFISLAYLYSLNKPWRFQNLERLKGKIEMINLGTSHGWDFYYPSLPLEGMNFNVAGNTLYYDLQNFRYLRNNKYLAENALVVIPVSYFAFGLDENRTDGTLTSSFVNDFYYYLPARYIFNYSLQKEVELYIYKIQNNFNKLIEIKPANGNKDEGLANPDQNTKPNEADLELQKKKHAEKIEKLAEKRVEHHLKLSEYSSKTKNVQYLKTLIQEIQTAGYQPVLVTTPYPRAYTEKFGEDYLEREYYSRMNKLASKYNILYLNYSHDERFIDNMELFMDSDHLNPEGRIMFSKIFYQDVIQLTKRSKRTNK